MPKRRGSRIYWRERGGERRAYGDFRDFADVGGRREPLKPEGAKQATSDPDIAQALAAARVEELERQRRDRTLLGVERRAQIGKYAEHHLLEKARSGRFSERWLQQTEQKLRVAIRFFGPTRDLHSIQVDHVKEYWKALQQLPGRGGRTISEGTQRHYLNVLSNLFTRAASEKYVPAGHNPVAALLDKPTARREEAAWLEPHEAALLLEAARLYRPATGVVTQGHGGAISAKANPHLYPILATFLLTGGRKSEVLGLEVEDVSFRRKTITFRPNAHRTLKTRTSHRSIPLWPQLEEILRAYMREAEAAGGLGQLLFPSARSPAGKELMVRDLRKALDQVAVRAGWAKGEIRTKAFRHTYCAARLQTLDRGFPVSAWTVARELGHGGTSMVERVYGHLGEIRHRAEELAYRVEDFREELAPRLDAVQQGGV